MSSSIHKKFLAFIIPIQRDVDIFLTRFAKKDPLVLSFDVFKSLWNDMHLHLIYSCRPIEDLFIFQDLLFDTVKARLFPPYAPLWNIGAIYLLFAFIELVPYQRHMTNIRPRMTLSELKKIQHLLQYLRVEEEHEASVILLNILQKHCVIAAESTSELNVEIRKQFSHRYENLQDSLNLLNESASSLAEMTTEKYIADQLESFGLIDKMVATNNQYCAMKELTPAIKESPICSLIGRDHLYNFTSGTAIIQYGSKSISGNMTSGGHVDDLIGARRVKLKNRSFVQNNSNRRRNSVVEVEATSSHSGPGRPIAPLPTPSKSYIFLKGSKIPTLETNEKLQHIINTRAIKTQKIYNYRHKLYKNTYEKKLAKMAKKIVKTENSEAITTRTSKKSKSAKKIIKSDNKYSIVKSPKKPSLSRNPANVAKTEDNLER
uniref:Uncharacterized protein n=1 Tax=Cacopsylla melanoneura TaxID=428564 RepID=A0A8D9ADV0_9HEMI